MIHKPMFPPKSGYVEVEVEGRRTYRNVITGILIDDEVPMPTMDNCVTSLEDALAVTDKEESP